MWPPPSETLATAPPPTAVVGTAVPAATRRLWYGELGAEATPPAPDAVAVVGDISDIVDVFNKSFSGVV